MRSRVLLRVGASGRAVRVGRLRTAPVTFPAVAPWEVRRPQCQARSISTSVGGASRPDTKASREPALGATGWALAADARGPLGTGAVRISASGNDFDIRTARASTWTAPRRTPISRRVWVRPPLRVCVTGSSEVPDRQTRHRRARSAATAPAGSHPGRLAHRLHLYRCRRRESLPGVHTATRRGARAALVDDWQL